MFCCVIPIGYGLIYEISTINIILVINEDIINISFKYEWVLWQRSPWLCPTYRWNMLG
jgi:hypothetical protein